MTNTEKFSQFNNEGDLLPGATVVGLADGANAYYTLANGFLPPGDTASRPTPGANVNYQQRFNTDLNQFEYYNPTIPAWVQLANA